MTRRVRLRYCLVFPLELLRTPVQSRLAQRLRLRFCVSTRRMAKAWRFSIRKTVRIRHSKPSTLKAATQRNTSEARRDHSYPESMDSPSEIVALEIRPPYTRLTAGR